MSKSALLVQAKRHCQMSEKRVPSWSVDILGIYYIPELIDSILFMRWGESDSI